MRFLAPFDPVIWDRARFEHLWGWAYRFEAYTPVKKRVRGYYAMPMLWKSDVTGWANAAIVAGKLDVKVGFINGRPRGVEFRRELDAEIARLEEFLRPQPVLNRSIELENSLSKILPGFLLFCFSFPRPSPRFSVSVSLGPCQPFAGE